MWTIPVFSDYGTLQPTVSIWELLSSGFGPTNIIKYYLSYIIAAACSSGQTDDSSREKAVLDDGAGAGGAGGAGGEIVSEHACPVVLSHHVSTTKQQVPSGALFGRALAAPPSARVCKAGQ